MLPNTTRSSSRNTWLLGTGTSDEEDHAEAVSRPERKEAPRLLRMEAVARAGRVSTHGPAATLRQKWENPHQEEVKDSMVWLHGGSRSD